MPKQLDNVSIICKANIYFDGKVTSHTILFPDGTKKSIGLLYTGAYTFNTEAPEKMEIIAGSCAVKIAGEQETKTYPAGTHFNVPEDSAFDIEIKEGIAEYVCSYL
jgi:uncharacterized protein YaiE (UPF0345 family)